MFLPALERTYTFLDRKTGNARPIKVALTDGGVYDNRGLSVLEPGRDARFTDHVYNVNYILACDAGRGTLKPSHARQAPFRLKRSFDITCRKTQDAGRARLHEAGLARTIDGFIHAYLGMPDTRLPLPVSGLIKAEDIRHYPTNFRAMSPASLDAITTRGKQLTRALVQFCCPQL